MWKASRIVLGLAWAGGSLLGQTDAHLYSPGTNLERSELAQLETATGSGGDIQFLDVFGADVDDFVDVLKRAFDQQELRVLEVALPIREEMYSSSTPRHLVEK